MVIVVVKVVLVVFPEVTVPFRTNVSSGSMSASSVTAIVLAPEYSPAGITTVEFTDAKSFAQAVPLALTQLITTFALKIFDKL